MHGTEDAEPTRFLPPEPAGPEPDLGARPAAAPQPQQPQAPPPQQPTYGYPPPPPGYGQQPPPGYGYAPPPPGYGQQPQPQPWAYAQQPPAPDNGQAITGFVFSLVALGLLVISFGLSTVFSLGCAIVGIICSRNGKKKVESGETPKHKGLAQAGFVIGWVALGFSILAIVAWALVFALGATDDSFRIDPEETRRVVALALGA